MRTDLASPPPVGSNHFIQPKVLWIGPESYTLLPQVTINTRNRIYIIQCFHCYYRYIDETGPNLQTHLNQHLHTIQAQKLDTPLVKYFANIAISIL